MKNKLLIFLPLKLCFVAGSKSRRKDALATTPVLRSKMREDIGVLRALGAQVAVMPGKVEEFTENKEKVDKQLAPEEGATKLVLTREEADRVVEELREETITERCAARELGKKGVLRAIQDQLGMDRTEAEREVQALLAIARYCRLLYFPIISLPEI